MKQFLQRIAFRLFLIFWLPYFFIAWMLAVPYQFMEWGTRREHLRDGLEAIQPRTLRLFWRGFLSGNPNSL